MCLEGHAFHEACSIAHDAVLRLLVASGSSPLFNLAGTGGTLEVLYTALSIISYQ